MSISEIAIGVAGLVLIPGLFVWMAVVIWFVHRRMDELLGYLTNSRGVHARGGRSKGSFRTMMMSFANVGMLVTFSRYFIGRGELSDNDVRSLPQSLKRQIIVLFVSGNVMGFAAVILGVTVKLKELMSQ